MGQQTLVVAPSLAARAPALCAAAEQRGLEVRELTSWQAPDSLDGVVGLYGPRRFGDAVGPALGLALLEAPDGWLADLPDELTGRHVTLMTIGEAWQIRRPVFVKSPWDKNIPALVYTDGSRLPGPDAVDRDTPVLVSDMVTFEREFRLFILDGAVHTGSRYAVEGTRDVGPLVADGLAFARDLLAEAALPSAVVVDIGQVRSDGGLRWAVVEANAAWSSGLYAEDPSRALDTILRSARPSAELSEADRAFLR